MLITVNRSYRLKYSFSIIQYTCSIQYTVYSILYTVYSIQYTVYSIQYTKIYCIFTKTSSASFIKLAVFASSSAFNFLENEILLVQTSFTVTPPARTWLFISRRRSSVGRYTKNDIKQLLNEVEQDMRNQYFCTSEYNKSYKLIGQI